MSNQSTKRGLKTSESQTPKKSPSAEVLTPSKTEAKSPKQTMSLTTGLAKNEDGDGFCDKETDDSLDSSSADMASEGPSEKSTRKRKPQKKKVKDEWIILSGLKDGQICEEKPEKYEGYMMKRRKWPLKGWHKRYCILENGFLVYGKSPELMNKGKLHGSVDVGLSVISVKTGQFRIDIDAEEFIYHFKFDIWVKQLRHHRLYRQHELSYGSHEAPRLTDIQSPIKDIASPVFPLEEKPEFCRKSSIIQDHGKLTMWVKESAGIETYNKELATVKNNIFQMGNILRQLQANQTDRGITMTVSCQEAKDVKKSPKLTVRCNRVSESSASSDKSSGFSEINKTSPTLRVSDFSDQLHTSTSSPVLPVMTTSADSGSPTDVSLLHEDFISLAEMVHNQMHGLLRSLCNERGRLRNVLENEATAITISPLVASSSKAHINGLKQALAEALQQNTDLRTRLSRIHTEASLTEADVSVTGFDGYSLVEKLPRHLSQSISQESATSASEYFDAEETPITDDVSTASEISDDDEDEDISSDISDEGTDYSVVPTTVDYSFDTQYKTGHRSRLPAPRPDVTSLNMWSLLRRNIGKDLSKISMPVTLNEPLNTLQRLCEDLEYSELLDTAANTIDRYERMVYVAAFAVSGYASTYYRAGSKPFNPLLGETYECIREDKGFQFIAEQVSHHPPVSVCHGESKNFTYWADVRFKNKFWGKSMEVQPIGYCSVFLPRWNETYKWNKVTTCIHNLLGGQRWVDQYGEMLIQSADVLCKLDFVKAGYWSQKASEVHGSVMDVNSSIVYELYGKWNEGLYCGISPHARCVWRPGAMPQDFEQYYGFTRFAIELNELDEDLAKFLPPTDTRLRPDQRALEEGNVQVAEAEKHRLEVLQRERRKKREEDGFEYESRWFKQKDETYVYNGLYWKQRKEPGFMNLTFAKLW